MSEKSHGNGPRHFLATDEWSDAAILELLDRAERLKRGVEHGSLAGKVLGLVFFTPSLRTRASFEVAMSRHHGSAAIIEPGKGAWSLETRRGVVMDGAAAEHLIEAARVLGRYVDALGVRAFPFEDTWEAARRDAIVRGFAEHAGVPVINLESARRHPCQGLADAMTLDEKLDGETHGKRFVLAWAWHPKALPTAVPVSAAIAAARLGMNVTIAHPPGFELDSDDIATIGAIAERRGGRLSIDDDLDRAVEGADVVYAKSWGSLSRFGDERGESALRADGRSWIIDERRMQSTREGRGVFLHCLPVRRNVVVTDGVLDGVWSAVVDQAEN
ncbi:MAG: N-acetylornithine carbamoyltransferase, partial [Acidobacteriota bacterium]